MVHIFTTAFVSKVIMTTPQGPIKFPPLPKYSLPTLAHSDLLFPSLRFIVHLTHWSPHTCLGTFPVIVSNCYLLQYSLQTFSMLSFQSLTRL